VPARRQKNAQLARFGASLRRERMSKRLTQERLAELCDLNTRTIQKIEAGQLNILLTTLMRLRHALGSAWTALLD